MPRLSPPGGPPLRLLLLVNSSASSVTTRTRVVIHKALAADHQVTTAETNRRGHATRLAQGAAATGTDAVVVLGGDGTLNEAANGLAGSQTALAPLPGGSTNVLARTLGLPDDPVEATAALLEALHSGWVRRVGLGSVNRRYFLFHCGIGFDAAVVARVERRGQLKRYVSHPLFLYAALATWIRGYDRRAPHFAVHLDHGEVITDGYFAICLNTDPYTYLGARPIRVAPEASFDRPLSLITLRSLRADRLVRVAAKALRGGPIGSNRFVDHRRDLSGFTVRSEAPVPYQVDGDYLGETTELHFAHEPAVLDLVMPSGCAPRPGAPSAAAPDADR